MRVKKAIILGAGFGKRMLPITKKIPKPLVKINGITLLENSIKFLISLGIKDIMVIAPAFSVDCLETIEEIDQENKEIFTKAGGNNFEYIPCLNDSQGQIRLIQEILNKHISVFK